MSDKAVRSCSTTPSLEYGRVAIVHYWLLGMRGGEKVLEEICRILPQAEIFTLFHDPYSVSPLINSRVVQTSFLNPVRRFYKSLLPLMPMALESFDLRGYDLVISSESGPAKGIITSSGTRHICYCHTPMRYLWELYPDYRNDFTRSVLKRAVMTFLTNYLRIWDFSTAVRVDEFIANSENVKWRIWKTYGRPARVIHPPVPVDTFYEKPARDYLLIVSELTKYKRLDYAIQAFSQTGRKLKVAGDGPDYKSLKKLAASSIEFCGRVSDAELRELYARSCGFVMPGEEDFGMTMVEALASGKPVIALGRGGALEIVSDGCGVLYPRPTAECLNNALLDFDAAQQTFHADFLRSRASKFSDSVFRRRFAAVLDSESLQTEVEPEFQSAHSS